MALQYGAINALVALVPRAPVDVVTPLLGQVTRRLASRSRASRRVRWEWVSRLRWRSSALHRLFSSRNVTAGAVRHRPRWHRRCPVRHALPVALVQVYPALGSMLKSAKDDGVEWVLTALDKVVRKVPDAAAACHSDISEVVLRIWWAGANDPFLAPTCQDLLGALAAIPACQTSLLSRILPSLR